ncbi:fluoride efflux transporter CrcB [Kangiella sediminilitoris]|uniref:Fluoride-specific ion channel FluC n=1 Tax=Kangiella sediminilitoris TaxID=1144748 RepID=A0A1B3BAZ0_9GAMM|nr:fluoride efflux transporter CrcB [Kangiella sediminilitoris]AOE49960.1 Putative fluoride ion transporter CrcB [Kangiella sediminilitoris]
MNWAVISAIGIGGAFGAIARFKIRHLSEWLLGEQFLYGTLMANVVGCFIAGFLITYWQNANVSMTLKEGVMIGFLGAFTTFSTFSLETMYLLQQQVWLKAGMNILGNLVLCMLFVFVGAWLGGRMSG